MKYSWFNREELLKKTNEKYHNKGGKQKAGEYCKRNKEAIKENARNKYKNLTKEEKELKRQYSKNRYNKLKQQCKVLMILKSNKKIFMLLRKQFFKM